MPGQRRVGAPVLAVEPDPAQVVECRDTAIQGLGPQIAVQRLQVAGLLETADQDEAFTQCCPLAGYAHTGVQPLQLAGTARHRNDALGKQTLEQWENIAGS
ncbi:hypothetical protein D3C79_687270 [compost metagenome]